MATHAFQHTVAENEVSLSKSDALVQKLANDFGASQKGRNYRLNLLLVFITLAAPVSCWIFFRGTKAANVPAKISSLTSSTVPNTEPPVIHSQEELVANPTPRKNPKLVAFMDSVKETDTLIVTKADPLPQPEKTNATQMHIPEDYFYANDDDIPVLSADEMRQTKKDKLSMMRSIGKKNIWAYVPEGTTRVNDAFASVNHFWIQDAEVTNIQYRTFLNDLLIQGRNEDYKQARYVDGGWMAMGIPEFEDLYPDNKMYNEFPAVNMTRRGAELYCEWLTASMNEAIANKDVKWNGKAPQFRLPSNIEWIYAARGCDSSMQYPWGKYVSGVQNARGCYLCNFNYSLSKDKVKEEGPKGKAGCISDKPNTRAIITTAGRSIDTLVTAWVTSYNPNTIGMYCTLGNVSEMVWTWDPNKADHKGEARSMGGSWYSEVDNVKIEAPEQYVGKTDACAYIGFRPVMVR